MLGTVAGFELRYQLRSPVFWVVSVMFLLLAVLVVCVPNLDIGLGANVHKNAPFSIIRAHLLFATFYMFVTTAFVAGVVVRDSETGFGPLIWTTRIRKTDYVIGRYIGAMSAAALSFLVVPIGLWIGSNMWWLDPETLGVFRPDAYVFAYFIVALPSVILSGSLFFLLATITRSMTWTYIGVVGFLVASSIGSLALDRPEFQKVFALLEPFGDGAISLTTRYWTSLERNTQLPELSGYLLHNRLIVLALSAALVILTTAIFRFQPGALSGKRRKQAKLVAAAAGEAPAPDHRTLASPSFGLATQWVQIIARTRLDLGQVFGSPVFLVIVAMGMVNIFFGLFFTVGETTYGGTIHPVTRVLLPVLTGAFSVLIPPIIATFFAGDLVWRERDRRTNEIIDATPVLDWSFVAPKVLAVSLVLLSTMLIGVLGAMIFQVFKGYTNFELGKYLLWYVIPQGASLCLLSVLAVFLQVVSPNKYVGWALMVVFLITTLSLAAKGFSHPLYQFGGGPVGPLIPLSDMNGQGKFWIGAWWVRVYWGFFGLILVVLSYALWRRGAETRMAPRLARLPRRLMGLAGLITIASVIGFGTTGVFIFQNTNIWNEFRSRTDQERWLADYEKVLIVQRHFDKVPQPKIQSMKFDVDLRPHQPMMRVTGFYVIKNTTGAALKEVHVRFDRDLKVRGLSIEGARPKETLDRFNYRIFVFDKPMEVDEVRTMSFITERSQKGFKANGNENSIVDNGTFINSGDFAPALGIWAGGGLEDRAKRRKYGLDPDRPIAKLGDEASRQFNYLRHDADFISADITITTVADQTPIAPGKRVSDQIVDTPTGKRRKARFVTQAPVMPFFSIQSARYAVSREVYKGVELEVYYDPAHPWNIERMKSAMKLSLDYYQANFSPYQFDYLRFIEFPDYARFAQAFAGTMPWSEGLFFIADYSDPSKIDMVTYVGSHEIAHQWWAHQVVGADQEGVTLMSETLAQYSALRVMKKLQGEDQIRKFLKYELDSYLRARGGQPLEEKPLNRVEPSQGYIHYRKGSLAMYRLADEIGEDTVNRALQKFLAAHAFKGAPYPISTDLIALFRAEATAAGYGQDKQDLITDLFEKIVLYDVKVASSSVTARKDGKFDVTMVVEARKLEADGKGKETARPMKEMLDVGVFTAQPGKKGFTSKNVLVLERRPIKTGKQTLTFTVDRKPTFVGVDPYNILIDRNSDDNVSKIGG